MKKQNSQKGDSATTTDDQQKILNIFKDADNLYEAVMAKLNIDHSDQIYTDLVLGMLKRQTKDHLIFSIWNNLDTAQTKHLRDYINQMSVIAPFVSNDDILMEFAMMYPELMERVYAGLSVFFKNFIKKFNEISRA